MTREIEMIIDSNKVFLRVSGTLFDGQEYSPSIIRQHGDDGLSVDWDKYSTDLECLQRGNELLDGVVSFLVGCVRELDISVEGLPPHLEVVHKPLENNPAHSLIVKLPDKKKKTDLRAIRNLLFGCLSLEIHSPKMIQNI